MANFTLGDIKILGAATLAEAKTAAYTAYTERLTDLAAMRAWAVTEVNRLANEAVIQAGILTPQLFFAANVSDIAFLITEWRAAGRPTELDPEIYYRAISEAQAYTETSDPTMTPVKMLQVWEAQWNWMRTGFADLNYGRRLALERIKLAESAEDIIEALAALPWGDNDSSRHRPGPGFPADPLQLAGIGVGDAEAAGLAAGERVLTEAGSQDIIGMDVYWPGLVDSGKNEGKRARTQHGPFVLHF